MIQKSQAKMSFKPATKQQLLGIRIPVNKMKLKESDLPLDLLYNK